jgi:hypothetical protein
MNHHDLLLKSFEHFSSLGNGLINSRNSLQVPCNELTTIDEQAGKEATRLIRSSVNALEKIFYAIVGCGVGLCIATNEPG